MVSFVFEDHIEIPFPGFELKRVEFTSYRLLLGKAIMFYSTLIFCFNVLL